MNLRTENMMDALLKIFMKQSHPLTGNFIRYYDKQDTIWEIHHIKPPINLITLSHNKL